MTKPNVLVKGRFTLLAERIAETKRIYFPEKQVRAPDRDKLCQSPTFAEREGKRSLLA